MVTGMRKKTQKKASPSKEIKARMKRVLVNPTQPPKPIGHLTWTKVGTEIQLDVGHMDFQELSAAMNAARNEGVGQGENEKGVEVSVYITDRFTASPKDILGVHQELTKLVNELRREGVLPPEGAKPN
jgi:hypothetical protein